jgi:hypothetical protein
MTRLADIQDILSKARNLADGPLKIALYEEAVRGADLLGDMDWRFYTRHELVRACFSGGDAERMLAALSWCLAKCDELGGCFDERRLLWGCKFALSYIYAFPQISRAQIESVRKDVIRRFRKYGASLRIPYLYGMCSELGMGYPERATEFRGLWLGAPQDEFRESAAWELYYDTYFHHASGAIERALDLGLPMIDGRSSSPDVSFWMVNLLLLELLKRGERKLAIDAHLQACRQCANNPKYIGHMGVHLAFSALIGNFARAAGLLERHLSVALRTPVPSAQFSFLLNAWTAAEHIQATTTRPARLRLPRQFPLWREDGTYEWAVLASWFQSHAHELEAQFNARNGNLHYTTFFTESVALLPFATNWSLRGRGGMQESRDE